MTTADDRDEALLRAQVAALVTRLGPARSRELLEELLPDPLHRVATEVQSAVDVEGLTRPLLETLHDVTGLASTYLTVVHETADEQEIRYSYNSRAGFEMPEGLRVPWSDTLCRRALHEGRACTTDVPSVWPDSDAAADLGIQTYVSVPVRLGDGSLWGTLCGADDAPVPDAERHLPTMGMFARLIATEVERAGMLAEARRAAEVDPLTGCANRHGIDGWLERTRQGDAERVAAVYVDVDRFKAVNDEHGHAAGDRVLRAFGLALRAASRDEDLVGRIGGDEFVVAAALREERVPAFLDRWGDRLQVRVELELGTLEVGASLGTAVVAGHEVGELLDRADRAMYTAKQGSR